MGKYTDIWKQQCTRILSALNGGRTTWTIPSESFLEVGDRNSSGYNVSVTFVDGKCSQKLGGSAVARDLRDMIINVAQKESDLFKGKTITMKMSKSFVFSIECSNNGKNIEKVVKTLPISAKKSVNSLKISSFPPIVDEKSEFLILGTMPGEDSLATGEYYANKNNIFWKIICNIFNEGKNFSTYKEKMECVKKHHIAIWDVLSHCKREGSTDEAIMEEEHNDIDSFLKQYPNIKKIVFNGKKPYSYYKPPTQISMAVALSTSPANRQYSDEERTNSWRQALNQ